MMDYQVSRRGAVVGFAMLASLSLVPGRSLAASSPAQDKRSLTTAALFRTVFPHEELSDSFYAGVAKRYLGEIDVDEARRAEHDRGLKLLDGSHIADFVDLPVVIQKKLVDKVDEAPFFKTLLWRGAELIYRDPEIWNLVGYEGSSLEYGGYKERGFDDIDWLPKGVAE